MTLAGRVIRLINTVRWLRPVQIFHQIYFRFGRPLILMRAGAPLEATPRRDWIGRWDAPRYLSARDAGDGSYEFLGQAGRIDAPRDWNDPGKSKLWLYNLHYLDDLDAADGDGRQDRQGQLIDRWIADNAPFSGNGWEPYPLSVRMVNLVKWFSRHDVVRADRLSSLARQAQALDAQVEYRLLGNHLFMNGKALVFAGAYLAGTSATRWLDRGLKILDQEICEQFLADGGHFERSPMYHASLLWDLCDLLYLSRCSGHPELARRQPGWRAVAERGMKWLSAMSHPDGDLSFFNDAAFGIAPRLTDICAYGSALGLQVPAPKEAEGKSTGSGIGVERLDSSGYVALTLPNGGKLLADVAPVGPDYQPGHAHADTLCFELSLFGRRVLVNSGTSCYGDGAERQRQRATAAHNTVCIDRTDSSEVWGGFRVARRAFPLGLEVARGVGSVRIRCAHDGYRRLPGRVTHTRTWELGDGMLHVVDEISGRFESAVARYYLHPNVRPGQERTLHLESGAVLRWQVTGGDVRLVHATWHPEFGASVATHCIEVHATGDRLDFALSW